MLKVKKRLVTDITKWVESITLTLFPYMPSEYPEEKPFIRQLPDNLYWCIQHQFGVTVGEKGDYFTFALDHHNPDLAEECEKAIVTLHHSIGIELVEPEIDKLPKFGQLKAGDKFLFQGQEYEKISGNTALHLLTDKYIEVDSKEIIIVTEEY